MEIPNGLDGISLLQSAGNTIGGTTSGAGNVIAFNTGAGVTVDTGTGNAIRQNSIFANRQGIVLTNGGNANQPAQHHRRRSVAAPIRRAQHHNDRASGQLSVICRQHHRHHRVLRQRTG